MQNVVVSLLALQMLTTWKLFIHTKKQIHQLYWIIKPVCTKSTCLYSGSSTAHAPGPEVLKQGEYCVLHRIPLVHKAYIWVWGRGCKNLWKHEQISKNNWEFNVSKKKNVICILKNVSLDNENQLAGFTFISLLAIALPGNVILYYLRLKHREDHWNKGPSKQLF